jgi:hypothetical protein
MFSLLLNGVASFRNYTIKQLDDSKLWIRKDVEGNDFRLGLQGFRTLSIIWNPKRNTKDHNVSETGSVSLLRWGGGGRHIMCWVCQKANLNHWTRLALSNGPNRVGVSHPLPEDRNRSSFWNTVFFHVFLLEYQTINKAQKPCNPECYIPSSEPFRI